MQLKSFDAELFSAEAFPKINRIVKLLKDGHDLEDLFAGAAFAQRLDGVIQAELEAVMKQHQQWQLALELLEPASKLAESPWPRSVFLSNLGYCYRNLGNFEKAVECYHAANDVFDSIEEDWADPAKAWLYNEFGWTHFLWERPADGVEWARKAVEIAAENWHAHGTLGTLLYELDDEEAFEAFETAMKNGVDPEPSATLAADARYQALAHKYDMPLPEGS